MAENFQVAYERLLETMGYEMLSRLPSRQRVIMLFDEMRRLDREQGWQEDMAHANKGDASAESAFGDEIPLAQAWLTEQGRMVEAETSSPAPLVVDQVL